MEMCPCGFLISAANDRMHTRGKWNWAAHLRASNTIVCQQLRSVTQRYTSRREQHPAPSSWKMQLEDKATVVVHDCHQKLTMHQLQLHLQCWDRKHHYHTASKALPRWTCVVRADISGEQSLTSKHWFHPLGESHLPIMWQRNFWIS